MLAEWRSASKEYGEACVGDGILMMPKSCANN